MKTVRSMVLVSSDPVSLERGAQQVYDELLQDDRGVWPERRNQRDAGRRSGPARCAADGRRVSRSGDLRAGHSRRMLHTWWKSICTKAASPPSLLAAKRELTGRIAWLQCAQGHAARRAAHRAGARGRDRSGEHRRRHRARRLSGAGQGADRDDSRQDVIAELERSGLQGRGGAGFPAGLKWKFVSKAPGDEEVRHLQCRRKRTGHVQRSPGAGRRSARDCRSAGAGGVCRGRGRRLHLHSRRIRTGAEARAAGDRAGARDGLAGPEYFRQHVQFRSARSHRRGRVHLRRRDRADRIDRRQARRTARASAVSHDATACGASPRWSTTSRRWRMCRAIIRNGAAWYRKFGTPKSPGTKVYTILGNVNVTGVIEVPMGITLREVIAIYAKGMKNGATFKLAQTGGSSGSVIPASLQDTPMDFESFGKAGVSLGSGALLICDEETCVVDLARVLLNFFKNESCGKCTPCRVGTHRAYDTADEDLRRAGRRRATSSSCCCWPMRWWRCRTAVWVRRPPCRSRIFSSTSAPRWTRTST